MKYLKLADFARSFGTTEKTFSPSCRKLIEETNFRYRPIVGDELNSLFLKILKRIDEDQQIIGSEKRQDVWNKGWQENFDEFTENSFDEDKLIPRFIRSNQPVRFEQEFIFPEHPNFELNFILVFRQWFLEKYFSETENIYEFGCGTGFNLLAAAQIFPKKIFFGSDFVQSSVDIISSIDKNKSISIQGDLFDMLQPDYNYQIRPNSGVFTFGSLEQLASNVDKMLDFLIDKKPKICVHSEPAIELYDPNNFSDYLAIKFQGKRGYTEGLLYKLQKLNEQREIELIKVKRLYFGSLYMEGYNLIVWKPL